MELSKYEKTLRFDGEIKFKLNEMGKLYKNPKDVTILAIENLLRKNNVSDGVYLLTETSCDYSGKVFKGKWIISFDSKKRVKIHYVENFSNELLDLFK